MTGLTYFSLFKLCSAASALLPSRTMQRRTIQHRAFRLLSGLGVGAIASTLTISPALAQGVSQTAGFNPQDLLRQVLQWFEGLGWVVGLPSLPSIFIALYIVAVATVAVTLYVTRIARQALAEKVSEQSLQLSQ